jgi:hypothetical protein
MKSYLFSPSKSSLLPIVITLYFILIQLAAAKNQNQNSKLDRLWKARKQNCEASPECRDIIPAEAANCINKCVSESCFEAIFASDPLEDGEIDRIRDRKFSDCVRKEERERTVINNQLQVE